MKPNESRTTKSRWVEMARDYLTVAFAACAWSAYGPRGWEMDETVRRLLFPRRTEGCAPILKSRASPAMHAECCTPAPCCAG